MEAAAVRFHDQPVLAPEEIGLESTVADVKRCIYLWTRQFGASAHSQEKTLEFTAGTLCRRVEFIDNQAKTGDPTAATTAPNQHTQRTEVECPQNFSLCESLSKLPDRNHPSEIQQRALHTRAGDPVQRGSIGWNQRTISVCVNTRWDTPTAIRCRDVDRSLTIIA
jgi:hypothetical protein